MVGLAYRIIMKEGPQMGTSPESFSYTYSAKQQEEVKSIRQKYIPSGESKMEQLRKLDRSATRPGKAVSIIVGIMSTLVLGIGMCYTMVWTQYFIPGIAIGIVGMAGIGMAFPIYSAMAKRRRKKLAPEIIKLSGELIGHE